MTASAPQFAVRLAETPDDLRQAARLRYDVFVAELGGAGPGVDHAARQERDRFDPHARHLLLLDDSRAPDDRVVGAYRLLTESGARAAGQFYSEDEYDLTLLRASGRPLLELGRSCLHRDYRGGAAMYHLWQGLAAFVADQSVAVLFGVASFHGTDARALAQPLSLLHHLHLAPPPLRVRARAFQPMDLLPLSAIDRHAAMVQTPALIKAYLRLGGVVGEGAFVDHAFNTVDVCLILDTAQMNLRQSAIYTRDRP